MKNSDLFYFILMTIVICVVSFGAYCNGVDSCERVMQQEAIKRGFAEYDAKTGEWRWKGEVSE